MSAAMLPERRLSPTAISLLVHAALTAAIAAIVLPGGFSTIGQEDESIPLEVIEAPAPALSPLKPLAPEAPPAQPPKSAPRSVFGAGRNSLRSDSGVEVKAGNTTAKAQDQEKLRDDDADSLPIPADEFLVSRMPELAKDFRVPYPETAKRQGVQGAVVFDLLIDEKGAVRQATLIEGPGAGLNEAALEAVKRLIFKPAFIEDRPVAVRIRYAYRFVLER